MLDTFLGFGVIFGAGFWVGRYKDIAKYEIHIGEQIVNQTIKAHLPSNQYHLLQNVTLPTADTMTTQIDHVLVCSYGIFVIETKHYAGLVFGSIDNAQWLQITKWDKRKFQNPLRQNYKHKKELELLLPEIDQKHIYSVVVFSGDAEFRTKMPENVIHARQMALYIRKFNKERLSKDDMVTALGRIQLMRMEESKETDQAHVKGLKARFNQ
tara:strand:+ start:27909 stop:28541 length:633 start_codon:yes stop_codon:yes gene_type:complete